MEKKQITLEDIIRDEKEFALPPAEVKPRKILTIPQMKLTLRETGIKYEVPTIANRNELCKFFLKLNQDECYEKFSVLAVNTRCKPISVYSICGSLSEVPAYPRVIVTFALMSNAHSVFFCHNHPGGTCQPSTEDIKTTIQLQRLLGSLGIMVLDHLITTPEGETYSMAQNGDITFGR